MTFITLISYFLAAILILFAGRHVTRTIYKGLPEECVRNIKKEKNNSRMILGMVVLVSIFFVLECWLEKRFVNSYFNWDKENMHILFLTMFPLITSLNVSRILAVDIPADTKKILVASELIQLCGLIILLGLYVNVFVYQRLQISI